MDRYEGARTCPFLSFLFFYLILYYQDKPDSEFVADIKNHSWRIKVPGIDPLVNQVLSEQSAHQAISESDVKKLEDVYKQVNISFVSVPVLFNLTIS
jgi:hypothetical protein